MSKIAEQLVAEVGTADQAIAELQPLAAAVAAETGDTMPVARRDVASAIAQLKVSERVLTPADQIRLVQLTRARGGKPKRARLDYSDEPLIIKGGITSGNFKHKSVKGKHGGSRPGGGHGSIGVKAGDDRAAVADKVNEHRFKQSQLRSRQGSGESGFKTLSVSSTMELPGPAAGAQESHIVTFDDGSRAIVKPDQGTEGNSTAHAERLAFEAARELGYENLVPETVVRNDIEVSGGREASVQRWVEDSTTYADREYAVQSKKPLSPPPPSLTQQTRNMLVLDFVVDNGDRHNYNMLIDDGGDVKAIDHGFAYRQKAVIGDRGRGREVQGRSWSQSRHRYRELYNESRPDATSNNQDPLTLTDREKGAMRALAQNKPYMDQVAKHLGTEARGRMRTRLNFAIEKGIIPL